MKTKKELKKLSNEELLALANHHGIPTTKEIYINIFYSKCNGKEFVEELNNFCKGYGLSLEEVYINQSYNSHDDDWGISFEAKIPLCFNIAEDKETVINRILSELERIERVNSFEMQQYEMLRKKFEKEEYCEMLENKKMKK